jgi:hypothetical protein
LAPAQRHKEKAYLIGLALLLTLVGCTTVRGFVDGDEAPEGIRKQFVLYGDKVSCKHDHGIWRVTGNSPLFKMGGYCQLPASDAGKPCQKSADCESYCELSAADEQDDQHPRCAALVPPRWDRCAPGYYENGKVLGRGQCYGDGTEVE